MRKVLPILIAGLLTTRMLPATEELSAEALLALDGPAFFEAAGDATVETFSTADLIKIAERLAREEKNFSDKDIGKRLFSRFFDEGCKKATSKEIDQLVGIYVRLAPGSFEKQFSLQDLAAAWMAREIASFEPTKVAISPIDVMPEPEMRDVSPGLIAGWKLYQILRPKADELFGESEDRRTINFQENEAAFYRLIDDVLLKRGNNLAERLAEFTWGGMSGTGSESLGEPRSMGIFMALLHERRLDEAVAATIRLHAMHPLVAGEQKESVRIAFLKKCGVDWEALFAGTLLATGAGWGDNPNLQELASEGSDRALTFLTELALRAPADSHMRYAYALAAFIPRDPEDHMYYGAQISRRVPIEISADAKKKIIQALEKFATPKASRDVGEAVVTALAWLKSPETKRALRGLIAHPSQRVAQRAAAALTSLGEVVSAPVSSPVQFKILTNRQPLPPKSPVSWGLAAEYDLVSNVTEVDETGTLHVPREHFIKERKPMTVELRSWSKSPAESVCFKVRIPVPKNLDAATTVDIGATPVQLVIEPQFKSADEPKSEATVRIRKHRDPGSDESDVAEILNWADKEFTTPVNAVPRFALQRGTYRLEVLSPGAERYVTSFEMASRAVTLRVPLKPGADLHVELVRPDGEREVSCELLRDGRTLTDTNVDSDHRGQTYRGLAVGQYLLHVPSSAERAAEGFDFAPLQQYAGKDIPFTISGDRPLVDLGEIHLEAAEKN